MQVKTGLITSPASSGNVSVTGVGFVPKVIMFLGIGSKTLNAVENIMLWSFGATDGTRQWACYDYQQHDGTSAGKDFNNSRCIYQSNGSSTIYATITSFDSDGFTLNWNVTGTGVSGFQFSYIALADVDAYVSTFTSNNATGVKSVTGVPFTPKCVLIGYAGASAAAGWQNGHISTIAESGEPWSQDHGIGTSYPSHYTTVYTENVTAWDLSQYAAFVGLTSDGFTYNVSSSSQAYTFGYIAIGGDNFHAWAKMEAIDRAVSGGLYTKTGLTFEPQFALAVDQCGVVGVTTFRISSSWTDSLSMYGRSSYVMSPDDWHRHAYSQLRDDGAALAAESLTGGLTSFSSITPDGFEWSYDGFNVGASKVGFLVFGEEAKVGGLSALGVG